MNETTELRATKEDVMARQASPKDLVTLLLLRHSSLLKISEDHPHKQTIRDARDSAERELNWRFSKFQEYQEMAALSCQMIDMLAELSNSTDLKDHIDLMKADKDQLIVNPLMRQQRFQASLMLFSLPKAK